MEHHHRQPHHLGGQQQRQGPTTSQVLAVVTLLPVGGFLLLLAGLTLAGTVIGLAVTTPLFILFSPVLVPAVLTIGLSVTGFLTSGAFGLTGLSSLTWIVNYLRKVNVPEKLEHGKERVQEASGIMGQKVKETGQELQGRAREGTRT